MEPKPQEPKAEADAAVVRAGIDDTSIFEECEEEPSEFAEEKLEPIDDNLVSYFSNSCFTQFCWKLCVWGSRV